MSNEFKGRKLLVVGGTSGIGVGSRVIIFPSAAGCCFVPAS